MLTWHRILCAVDLQEGSRPALEAAADLARRLDAELTLVHVHEPHPVAEARAAASSPALLEHEALELGRKLDGWRKAAEELSGRAPRTVLASGAPAAEIVRAAETGSASLVVVGTRGRRGLERLVIGSVAERVVRDAPCPVLVARAPPG